MSDDSAVFCGDSPSAVGKNCFGELDELYKYISPPLPLIPKNRYTVSVPKSHMMLEYVKRFSGVENEHPQGLENTLCNTESLPKVSLSSMCKGKDVVYKRDGSRLWSHSYLDLSKISLSNESGIKQFEDIESFYKPRINDATLVFESRFESGNLALAAKVSDFEYNLLMQNDINTQGHTQWFYFRVSNTSKASVKFNILNFSKKDSLYNQGMKVLIYSEKENELNNTGWYRAGENILYFQNNIKRQKAMKSYYTLSFSYEFKHNNDTLYFSYSYPYTYSHLMQDLQSIENLDIVTRKLLCSSIAGNRCDYLTITAPGSPEEFKTRKGIVFTARVHPGETVGSWMMKGVLDFITGDSIDAQKLRQMYVFKVVPMLNPDGVINGNYRCGLAGVDLNRRWKNPSKKMHPTVYAAKKLIKSFAKEREVELICDFHGHSRRKNIFTYGCNILDNPAVTRALPYIISQISPHFSYKFCSFRMQKSKEGTMRIALFNETQIPLIYTLESSFCGSDKPGCEKTHFTTQNLQDMGKQVCLSILIYSGSKASDQQLPTEETLKLTSILEELKSNEELLVDDNSDSSGSDSDPSDDNLEPNKLRKYVRAVKKPKAVRTAKPRKISRSESRTKNEPVKRTVTSKPNLFQKCGSCAEAISATHFCKTPAKGKVKAARTTGNSYKMLPAPYYNLAGRKVRDQATQTERDDKGFLDSDRNSLKSDRSTNLSLASATDGERSFEGTYILKHKNGLPDLGKQKQFMNFIIGEKIRRL